MNPRTRFSVEIAVLLLLGGLLYAKATPQEKDKPVPEVVRAQRFELMDAKGNVRGVFATRQGGDVVFSLLSKEQKPMATLAVLGDDSIGISLGRDADKNQGVNIAVKPDGTRGLVMANKNKGTVAIGVDGEGNSVLQLTGRDGKERTIVP